MQGLSPVFLGLVRTPPDERDINAIMAGEASMLVQLKVLERHLAGRAFMMGTSFTVADIPIGAAVHRWYALPIAHPEFPSIHAWYERLKQRPGYKTHVMLPLS